MSFEYEVGNIVKLKKKHPCGSFEWEILLVGSAVGGLAAGTVGSLVLAIGIAVLTAVFHGVNAPFGRCCGGGAALTVHSVAAAGGFIHPMGGKEYAYGIF